MESANKVSQQGRTGRSGDAVTVLSFTGDITSASREAVVGAYDALDKAGQRRVLLDFGKVSYLNSSGIALVIHVLMEAHRAGQQVAIVGLTPHFTKVFTMVGIAKYAGLYPDEAAALAAL